MKYFNGKLVTFAVLLLIVASLVVACGGEATPAAPEAQEEAAQEEPAQEEAAEEAPAEAEGPAAAAEGVPYKIGFVAAITLYTELFDILRFKRFDELASYVGLVPSLTSTGETSTEYGITQRKNRHLRYILIEAAWVAIRCDPALLLKYNELTKRMKNQDAIVRIAKKLLRRIRSVWLNEVPYVCAVID